MIANGPLAGKDLHWLIEHHAEQLMGLSWDASPRFPLLVKILDAREKLSLQVHPPASLARELGGEPKTEMWYISQADEGSELPHQYLDRNEVVNHVGAAVDVSLFGLGLAVGINGSCEQLYWATDFRHVPQVFPRPPTERFFDSR